MQLRRSRRLLFSATLALTATTITVGGPAGADDAVGDEGRRSPIVSADPFEAVLLESPVLGGILAADSVPVPSGADMSTEHRDGSNHLLPYVELDVLVNDVVADPIRDVVYASVRDDDVNHPNTIATIDVLTGEVLSTREVGGDPNALAIAADGSVLYVGIDDTGSLVQLELPAMTIGWIHDLGQGRYDDLVAEDIEVAPDDPDLVVVSVDDSYLSPPFRHVVAIDNGVARPNLAYSPLPGDRVEFGASSDVVYGYRTSSNAYDIGKFRLDANGLTSTATQNIAGSRPGDEFEYAGYLYSIDPRGINDPATWPMTPVGAFDPDGNDFRHGRVIAIEPNAQRATFIDYTELEPHLVVHQPLDSGPIVETWDLPENMGNPRALRVVSEDDGILALVTYDGAAYLLYPGHLRGSNGEFTALTPRRLLDTRRGIGTAGVIGPIGANSTIDVQVTGLVGIPETGVKAVVMNVTTVDPTRGTFLSIYPNGIGQPDISNLNTAAGKNRANLVTVRVGDDGKVTVYNAFGSAHVLFDVAGYYADGDGPDGARYRAIGPVRIADNRHDIGGIGIGKLGAGETATIDVAGRHGVPATGAAAVVLNITSSQSTARSFMTVFPGDVARPDASNLNFNPGDDTPNQVIVRVPADGTIDIYNDAGETFLIVDLVGYFETGGDIQRGRFLAANPFRAVDTRRSSPFPATGELWAGDILYYGSENETFSAYALNVTVTGTIGAGFVSTYPYPGDPPATSTLNYGPGDTVANHAIVSTGPYLGFLNQSGKTHLIFDIFGAFT